MSINEDAVAELVGPLPPEWNAIPSGALFEFKNGLNYTADQVGSGVQVIGVGDFGNKMRLAYRQFQRIQVHPGLDQSYFLHDNDLLFVRSNGNKALVGRVLLIEGIKERISHSGFTIRGRLANDDINPLFAAYFFSSSLVKKQFLKLGGGTNISNLSQDILKNVVFPRPPLDEQEKIAAILSSWDRAIELTEKLIAAKTMHKHAITQQLLNRNGLLNPSSSLKMVKLSSLLRRLNDPVTVEPTSMYSEIGIRSHGKGVFHKDPTIGKNLGDKRVFKVHPNCFVFNVVFAWEQAIAKTTDNERGMIASHRFPMYQSIDNKIDLDFLLYFFKTSKGKDLLGLASPGGAGRNRTLSQKGFLSTSIPLPPLKQQRAIAVALCAMDSELDLLRERWNCLKMQKRGLMQQLLTGKVRVKVSDESPRE